MECPLFNLNDVRIRLINFFNDIIKKVAGPNTKNMCWVLAKLRGIIAASGKGAGSLISIGLVGSSQFADIDDTANNWSFEERE